MRCRACDLENAQDASFCRSCGKPLALLCDHCGRAVRSDSRFCDGCGQPVHPTTGTQPTPASRTPPHLARRILRDRAALEGERRTVTVLYIDAVGSVSTGGKLDHEDLHQIVRNCTQRMVDAVHRFEGSVVQFRGDGIMALFGAPIAHEDTARRALSAALAMRASLHAYQEELQREGRAGFEYRIGINTGLVIVGRIGDDLSMDYTAIGDTVALASRMEQWAPPGRIYLTEQTHRPASSYFEFADLGMLEVKGKGEAVHAFEVLSENPSRTRLDAAADRGLTPYVGRQHELSVLRGHFEEARAGRGQVVFISGEAGIGKSRLLLEFKATLAEEDLTWVTGQCISYGRNMPYLPIVGLLRQALGIEESDDEQTIIARIDERAARWDDVTRASAPFVKYLLNIDPGDPQVARMDPMERRPAILDALRALVIRGSNQRQVVIVFEDLHWVDEMSEEAIGALADVTASARVLMILTYRPGYAHSLGDRTFYNRLALQRLPAVESEAVLDRVLDGACPDAIRQVVTSKAEGNPFFIEEVTKSLIETGAVRRVNGSLTLARPIEDIYVPESIQEVVLTRIDRLQAEAREALQLASVIGREFTVRLLDRISEANVRLEGVLSELRGLELIYEKSYIPELSYMFKHALTHDVAYSTLLEARRRALHRIVAAATEELYPDRLAEYYETLAYHYERAEDWQHAHDYLMKAGAKAAGAYANQDAIAFFTRAYDAAERMGPDARSGAYEAVFNRGGVKNTIGDLTYAAEDYLLAASIAESIPDANRQSKAVAEAGFAQGFAHEFEQGEDTLRRALALAEQADDQEIATTAHMYLGALFIWTGRLNEGEAELAIVEARRASLASAVPRAFHALFATSLQGWKSGYQTAIDSYQRALPLYEAAGDVFTHACAMWANALALGPAGQYERAIEDLQEVIRFCERAGEPLFPMRSINSIGWVYGELENHERALSQNLRGIEAALAIPLLDPEVEMNARLNAADNLLALERSADAQEQLTLVERVVRNPQPPERWMLWRYSQHYFHTQGELSLAEGDFERALGLADECIALATATGVLKNIVKGRRLRGQALMARAEFDAAASDLTAALDLALEIGNPGQIWKTQAAVGDLHSRSNRPAEARESYAAALAVLERVAGSLRDNELRETLLASASVTRLRAQVAK